MYGIVTWGGGLTSCGHCTKLSRWGYVRVISEVAGLLARSCTFTFTTAFGDRHIVASTLTAVIEVLYRPQVDITCLDMVLQKIP